MHYKKINTKYFIDMYPQWDKEEVKNDKTHCNMEIQRK